VDSNNKSSEDLKKARESRYPAYVNKIAEIVGIAPFYLMPLWTSVSKRLSKQESFQKLSDVSTYIQVSKAFREELISKKLVTIKDIERHLNAPTTTT